MKADEIYSKIMDEIVKPDIDRKLLRDLVYDLRGTVEKEVTEEISEIFLGSISKQNKKLR